MKRAMPFYPCAISVIARFRLGSIFSLIDLRVFMMSLPARSQSKHIDVSGIGVDAALCLVSTLRNHSALVMTGDDVRAITVVTALTIKTRLAVRRQWLSN